MRWRVGIGRAACLAALLAAAAGCRAPHEDPRCLVNSAPDRLVGPAWGPVVVAEGTAPAPAAR